MALERTPNFWEGGKFQPLKSKSWFPERKIYRSLSASQLAWRSQRAGNKLNWLTARKRRTVASQDAWRRRIEKVELATIKLSYPNNWKAGCKAGGVKMLTILVAVSSQWYSSGQDVAGHGCKTDACENLQIAEARHTAGKPNWQQFSSPGRSQEKSEAARPKTDPASRGDQGYQSSCYSQVLSNLRAR